MVAGTEGRFETVSIEARRHSPRAKLHETAYINFGPQNRGVVLDVSEGGLRFETTSPLEMIEPVRFWLTFDRRSEADAALAWSNESRTAGGLRFTSLPPEMYQQIRAWMDHSLSAPLVLRRSPSVNAEEVAPRAGEAEQAALQSNDGRGAIEEASAQPVELATAPEEPVEDSASETTPDCIGAAPERLTPIPPSPQENSDVLPRSALVANESKLSMFSAERTSTGEYSFVAPQPSNHRLAVAALVVLFVLSAAVGAAVYFYPREAREAMNRVQAKIARFLNPAPKRPISNAEPAAMGAPSAYNPGSAATPESLPPRLDGTDGSSTPIEGGTAGTTERQRSGEPSGPMKVTRNQSEGDLTQARSYLTSGSTPYEKAKAVQLLWLATEKGNVAAEIQLADLYARGLAVPKSCQQARILLKAAAVANPALARPKLAELDKADCN